MSTENGAPPDGGSAPPPQDTTAPVAVVTAPAPEEFKLSKQEWLDFRREMRSKLERPTTPADEGKAKASPAVPADATASKLADLEFRLELKDAISAAGIADRTFAELVEKAARAERPTDMAAFVAKYAGFAPRPATAAAAPAAPAPTAPSNTGAAAAAPSSGQLPDNPLLWDAATVRKTGAVAWRKALEEYDARTGKGDPLHALRRRKPGQ